MRQQLESKKLSMTLNDRNYRSVANVPSRNLDNYIDKSSIKKKHNNLLRQITQLGKENRNLDSSIVYYNHQLDTLKHKIDELKSIDDKISVELGKSHIDILLFSL